jgi:hypothetical protein
MKLASSTSPPISPSCTEHIARVGLQLLYAMVFNCPDKAVWPCCLHSVILLRRSATLAPMLASHHSFTVWVVDVDWGVGLVCFVVCNAAPDRGQRICKVTCLRFAHCDLDSLVRYSAVEVHLLQRALMLPATSVRDTDCVRETQTFDSGAHGGVRLHRAPRAFHLGCHHGCRSLRCHRRSRSAGKRP